MRRNFIYKVFKSFAILLTSLLAFCGEAMAGSVGNSSSGFYMCYSTSNSNITVTNPCSNKYTIVVTPNAYNTVSHTFGFLNDGVRVAYSNVVSSLSLSSCSSHSIAENGVYLAELNNLGFYNNDYPSITVNFPSNSTGNVSYTFNVVYSNGVVTISDGQASCGPTVGSLLFPDAVCENGNLTLTVPSYSGATSTGWEISSTSDFASKTSWTNGSAMSYSHNGKYIRFWASSNSDGTNAVYSNPVQITVTPYLTVTGFTSTSALYCSGNPATLSVATNQNTTCIAGNTVKYAWFKGGVQQGSETAGATYAVPGAGVYSAKVLVKNSSNVTIGEFSTGNITISSPSNAFTVDNASLALVNLYGATSHATGTATATVTYCDESTTGVLTGTNADKFSISKNGNGYTVTFNETAAPGTYTATLEITHASGGTKSVAITGTVSTPTMAITPTSLAFENSLGGTAMQKTFTVTLANAATGYVTATSSTPTYKVESVVDNHDGTYTVTVSFLNTVLEGTGYTGAITVTANGLPIADQTVALTGAVVCTPLSIEFVDLGGTSLSTITPCGCNNIWYVKATNSYSYDYQLALAIKIGGVWVKSSSNPTVTASSLSRNDNWWCAAASSQVSAFQLPSAISGGGSKYFILTNTGSGYTLSASVDEPSCAPKVTAFAPSATCKNSTFGALTFPTSPIVSSSASVSSQWWEYSENGTSGWTATTSGLVLDKPYYLRYAAKDNLNRTGYSNTVQISFLAAPTIVISEPTQICAGSTFSDLNLSITSDDNHGCTYTDAGGWQYSENNSSWTDLGTNYFKVMDKPYYIRYVHSNANGQGRSASVRVAFKAKPVVNDIVAPNRYCKGTSVQAPATPSYTYSDCEDNTVTATWQYSVDNGLTYTNVSDLSTLQTDGTLLRYAVTDINGTGYSNAVTLEVAEKPSITIGQPAAICGGENLALAAPVVTDKYSTTFSNQTWQISANNTTYNSLSTNAGYTETTNSMSASQNNYYVRFTATNTCGIGYSEAKQITVNTPGLTLSGVDNTLYGIAGMEATLATAVATRVCIDPDESITYSLTDTSNKFTIDATGVISVNNTGTAAIYGLTVIATTLNQGGNPVSVSKDFTVELKNTPTLSLVCPTGTVSGNICHTLNDITYTVNSANIVGNVSVALSGTMAEFFDAPASIVEGDGKSLVISQKAGKTIAKGDYTLTLTVTAKGGDNVPLTQTCDLAFSMSNVDHSIVVDLKTVGGNSEPTIFCSEELGLKATVGSGVEVARYIWYNDTILDGKTNNNERTTTFACTGSDYDVNVSVQAMSKLGCVNTATLPVHIKKLNTTYYYCGSTGASSDVTNKSNWCTSESGTAGSCTSPISFEAQGCEYIINKDNVQLKADQTWTVSGVGSKITVGNGKWTSLSAPSYTSSLNTSLSTQNDYAMPKGYSVFASSYTAANDQTKMYSKVSEMDYRTNAKTFTVSGTMTLTNGVDIDVRCGSELEIATDMGNPDIGYCEQMWSYNGTYDGAHTNVYNECIIPGSIVTYSGTGATKVQAEAYNNVFINTNGAVVWEDGETEIFGQLKLDKTPSSSDLEGVTLYYDGIVNQSIAPLTYDNLQLQNATTKKLVGNTTVNGQLTIGSGATFDAGDNAYTLNLTHCDVPVVYNGNFDAGNSTVLYSGACNQTIAPMYYYNLSMTNSDKTFSNTNIIGVAGSFNPEASHTYTIEGSSVEFNGTAAQHIPAFTFNRLIINNKSNPTTVGVTMDGNVTVSGQLEMTDGALNTAGKSLLVTNNAPSAVMNGYYKDATHQSFINGSLTRYLPKGHTGEEFTQQYIFPVGNTTNGYIPLTLSQLTTESSTEQPMVTVTAVNGSNGISGGTDVTKLNTSYYWSVDGNSAYTSGRVSLATQQNATLSSLDYNSVVYSNGLSTYDPLNGTTLNSSVIRSNAYPEGYYTFGKITVNTKTYYYDCSSTSGDITNINNWWTEENHTGVNATSFTEDYATWIIKCNATVSKDLSILGSNTKVIVDEGASLTVNSDVLFSSLQMKKNSDVINNTRLTVMEKFTIDPTGLPIGSSSRPSQVATLTNNGELNIYAEDFYVADSWVYNNANASMNFNNTNMTIYDPNTNDGNDYAHNGNAGHVINAGKVSMVNSGLTVHGRFAQLKNIAGASWVIDNSSSAVQRTILFEAAELYHGANDFVSLECGSSFQVKNSDVRVEYVGNVTGSGENEPVRMGGDLIVEDGNLSFHRYSGQGGGTITVEQQCGGVFLYDRDNSGDGILTVYSSNSSTNFNIEGTLYTMGFVQEGGSGAMMNIKDGGFAFIGDMGATLSGYSWNYQININKGGILHYCGNRTATSDNVGKNEGELYYAENFYLSDDPVHQGDFTNLSPATYDALYESLEACMAAYLGTSAELLPIELTMLYGVCAEETIELHWQTMSETNSDYFAILRSFDGVTFEEVEIMFGAGTTTEVNNYTYYDNVDYSGVVYYKLRQYDFDGVYTESKVIAVQTCGKNAHFLFKENEIEVTFENPAVRNTVIVTSITGMILYSKTFDSVETARIAMPRTSGVYIISAIDNKQITSEKFINK